ncbi:ArnT family glycosyltransferase [Stenoxybacter acetivorans]|uniref:ArnT family glycosyltransferase n=1 Tax=Stenoxybacter acetivorans TaxID=422441 RepID=UPI00055B287E|nr:hypothetical protein [Stenoxybacter acetivorans]
MLTYTPPSNVSSTSNHRKPYLLWLLVFVWLWPGVFAHDLWSIDEAHLFTVIEQWQADRWAIPTFFGQADWTSSPLYVWLGVLSQSVLTPWLKDAFAAVRMVNVLLTVLSLACIGGAARSFIGRGSGRFAVLILIGCPGLLTPAHFMSTLPPLLAGCAMCLYGLSLARTRVMMACLMLGGGWVVLSVSGSLLLPLLMMLSVGLLWFHPFWRYRRFGLVLGIALFLTPLSETVYHRRLGLVFGIALLWSVPLMLIWPLALWQTDAALFHQWLRFHLFEPFGGLGEWQMRFSLGYYLKNLLWFAFPAWPLAIWTAWRLPLMRCDWGVFCVYWLALFGVFFALLPLQFQDLLVLLLPPLALIGAAKLDALRRGAAAFLNWFGVMTFSLLAVFLWLGFFAMNYGWPTKLAERSAYFSPYYRVDIDYFPLLVALAGMILWLWAMTRKHIRARQAVTNWAAGITLVWTLLLTLFLPWLDAAKSQRPVVQHIQQVFNSDEVALLQQGSECVSINRTDYPIRIAWRQYGWLKLDTDNTYCNYRLVNRSPNQTADSGWREIIAGARPREKQHIWALWQRIDAAPNLTTEQKP